MVDHVVGSRYQLRLGAGPQAEGEAYFAVHPYDLAYLDGGPGSPDVDAIGYVHSVEIGSTVDGPGMRFVLFLTGCALRCRYCHNPDTWHLKNGRRFKVSEVVREINRYADVLRVARGGLTISGGEPGLQPEFVRRIFRECRKLGVHTCLDTSGFKGEQFTDTDLRDIDLQILDIKAGDAELYQRLTRQPLQPTLDYARRLAGLARPLWVRFVLVPGLTDDPEQIARLADFCAELGSLERVEVLPFHQLGREKWQKLGLDYKLADTPPPDAGLIERVRQQFRDRGLAVY
jgi:pyruvate formate lyase activating enzyme